MIAAIHQVKQSERQKRQAVMRQFEMQLSRYPVLRLLERLTNYRYKLKLHDEVREVDVLATVLSASFDYYTYRLNLSRHGYTMVICQHHNCVLPVYVLELNSSIMYAPGEIPDIVRPSGKRKKRNAEEVQLFISALICSKDAAVQELATMPKRTRQHYEALRDVYLKPRPGRPWAS